jgi:hypothetical protein
MRKALCSREIMFMNTGPRKSYASVLQIEDMSWLRDTSKSMHGETSLDKLHKTCNSPRLNVSAHLKPGP